MLRSFWKRNPTETSAAALDLEPVKPAQVAVKYVSLPIPNAYEVKPDLNVDEFAEYRKVASAIGLTQSESIFNESMRQCMATNGLRQFNTNQVARFLNQKLGKWKWNWMGLRKSDVDHLKGWYQEADGSKVEFGDQQYGRDVPLPVLLTVQRILEEVPDAHFYISGIPGVDDDPFLLVTKQRGSSFIVERWDEPDFRER